MQTTNYKVNVRDLKCPEAGVLRASFPEIATTFVRAWQKAGQDMDLLVEASDSDQLSSGLAQRRIDAKTDAVEYAKSCIPSHVITKEIAVKTKKSQRLANPEQSITYDVVEPLYQIDDKAWTSYTGWVSAKAMDCPGARELYYKENMDKIDPNKFKLGLNMLFDHMYFIPGGKSKVNRAKVLFAHAMINTKRLILGEQDSYQQVFGLWSEEKGRGKDVFIQSLGYALTGKIPTSHKITDISSNFNVDLARTHGMYYVAEMGKITEELKNNLKNLITAPVIRMEKKGVDPISCRRKFTVFMSCNEDLGPLFWDEAKERRCASVETYGSNYMYRTARNIDNGNLYCLLVPFFEKLWEYCPMNLSDLGLSIDNTQRLAEIPCRSNLEKCIRVFQHLKLIAEVDENSPRQIDGKGWGPTAEGWFTEGKSFTKGNLEDLLSDTNFKNGQFHTFLNQFISPNNGFCTRLEKNGWFKLDLESAQKMEAELQNAYDLEFISGKPQVELDIDAIAKSLEEGRMFEFPKPTFKIKTEADTDAEFEANW